MKHRIGISHMFFTLAIVFATLSIVNSAAISQVRLERQAFARISSDPGAFLELSGFDNESYDLWSKYEPIGSITNNTGRKIALTVTIQTEFLQLQNKNSYFGVKIKSISREFNEESSDEQIEVILESGEVIDVEALLHPGQNTIVVATFQFSATDIEGTLDLQLQDTLLNPRRIVCY